MARKKKAKQDFYQMLDSFIDELYENGTIRRWEAEKRLKAQERKLNRLDREAAAKRKTLEEVRLKKSA